MTELIPFDLEKALAGEPVVTRDGQKVLQIKYCALAKDHSRLKVLMKDWTVTEYYRESGKYYEYTDSDFDLFMAPKPKKKLWIAVEKEKDEENIHRCSLAFSSKEDCIKDADLEFADYHMIQIEVPE